jgi:hypothetical protein
MAKRKLNWLLEWEPFNWHGAEKAKIDANKETIETKVKAFLSRSDQKAKEAGLRGRTHTIKLTWFKGVEDPLSFVLFAELNPAPKKTFGGAQSVITPTPPRQP